MSITNTKKNPQPTWLLGGNPDAIVAQEKAGHQELLQSSQLPLKVNSVGSSYHSKMSAEEVYKKLGIKVIGASKGDDLFLDVELPAGWQKQAVGHDMWTDLLDNKGRKRIAIFYKAAFYDRSAFVNVNKRYFWTSHYNDDNSVKCVVVDSSNESILYETKSYKVDWANDRDGAITTERAYRKEAEDWLQKHYPDHEDAFKYWD